MTGLVKANSVSESVTTLDRIQRTHFEVVDL